MFTYSGLSGNCYIFRFIWKCLFIQVYLEMFIYSGLNGNVYIQVYLEMFKYRPGSSGNVYIFRFIWKVGSWSDCLIEEGLKEDQGRGEEGVGKRCGGGIRIRNATCLDTEAGKPAPPHLCTSKNQPFTHPLVER